MHQDRLATVAPHTLEAWSAAPVLFVAGLTMLIQRKRLTAPTVRIREWLREEISIPPKHEPVWLRPWFPSPACCGPSSVSPRWVSCSR